MSKKWEIDDETKESLKCFIILLMIAITIISISYVPINENFSDAAKTRVYANIYYSVFFTILLIIFLFIKPRLITKNVQIGITSFLIIFSILTLFFFLAISFNPNMPGYIRSVENENNIEIDYQLRSYKESRYPVPGDKLCTRFIINNNNNYPVNISGNTSLTSPNMQTTERYTHIQIPSNGSFDKKKLCTDIMNSGLNTWLLDLKIITENGSESLIRKELSVRIYEYENVDNLNFWTLGSVAGLFVFITLIPKFVKDLDEIYNKTPKPTRKN